MLKIHEAVSATGETCPVFLRFEDGVLAIVDDDGALALPEGALGAVMKRFAAPLERTERIVPVAQLELGHGEVLHHVRHLGRYDVIARDYLVYELPDREPVYALATTVAGALGHLARAATATGR